MKTITEIREQIMRILNESKTQQNLNTLSVCCAESLDRIIIAVNTLLSMDVIEENKEPVLLNDCYGNSKSFRRIALKGYCREVRDDLKW